MVGKKEEKDPRIVEVGKKLKELRVKAGYSNYEHFAWDNDLNRQQYHNMEIGKNFTIKSLLRVLDIHKLTIKEFFASEI